MDRREEGLERRREALLDSRSGRRRRDGLTVEERALVADSAVRRAVGVGSWADIEEAFLYVRR